MIQDKQTRAMVSSETLHSKEALHSSATLNALMIVHIDGGYLKNPIDHIKDKLLEVYVGGPNMYD